MSGFTTTNRRDFYDIMAMDLPEVMMGHFWVVRDGRVIDPKFPEHRDIQRQNRLQDVFSADFRRPPLLWNVFLQRRY